MGRKTVESAEPDPKGELRLPESEAGNWHLTERLLETLNQELGGLKEYVLTELRGEITMLRSQKLQLQSQVQELRHEQELLLSDRQQAQQQLWAEQFAQVLAQNLRQEVQSQVLGLSESGGNAASPEQRLSLLHQQMLGLEDSLAGAMRAVQRDLGQHESDLSQQLLRMRDLEQQGERLLQALVEQLGRGRDGIQGRWCGRFPESSQRSEGGNGARCACGSGLGPGGDAIAASWGWGWGWRGCSLHCRYSCCCS
ncbi:MAG: hypothetical protein HC824_20605 [Synechococcales cyanobacterium RM1_1_8]|nr:hypothetical protein [Synechococcales cyanobacterium RM1_1_8]